jgi:hypothetical protein
MNSKTRLINISVEKNIKDDFSFFASFDITMIKIIQKFYGDGLDPVSGNLNTFCTQQLYRLLREEGLKISLEGLRKKLDFLVKIGFLEKVKTYPRIYMPVNSIEKIERIQLTIQKLKQFIFL